MFPASQPTTTPTPRMVRLRALAGIACLLSLTGCSLFVMAGKMLFGDPEVDCAFYLATQVDLKEGKDSVIVVCTAPLAVSNDDMAGISYQLVEDVSRQLRRQNVEVITSNKVRSYMDDNGGLLDDPRDLADKFDVDFIIHIDLQQISWLEDNSPDLYRGQASGEVVAYQVSEEDGNVATRQVFANSFSSVYPTVNPIPAIQVDSPRIFQKRFLDRVASQVAHLLYNHRMSEEVY